MILQAVQARSLNDANPYIFILSVSILKTLLPRTPPPPFLHLFP